MYNRGFSRRDTHLYAHDFATSFGFLLYSAFNKNKLIKTLELSINIMEGFEISTVCVPIFLYFEILKLKFGNVVCTK